MKSLPGDDRQAVEALIYRYAWASDGQDFEVLQDLFDPEGELVIRDLRKGSVQAVQGAGAIAAFVRERHAAAFARGDRRRHVTSNFFIDRVEGDVAVARSYFCVFNAIDGQTRPPASTGHYEDRVRKSSDGWKFVQRLITIEAGWTETE